MNFKINSYVFSEGCKCYKKSVSLDERSTHTSECELNVDHITITLAIQWKRPAAGMEHLASAVPQLQHERGGEY